MPGQYQPRRPSQSVLYRCVQQHLETSLAHSREGHYDDGPVPAHVERAFCRYVECGILAHGFARARYGKCGHDFLIAFSCKGRGVCPSCNGRRMCKPRRISVIMTGQSTRMPPITARTKKTANAANATSALLHAGTNAAPLASDRSTYQSGSIIEAQSNSAAGGRG